MENWKQQAAVQKATGAQRGTTAFMAPEMLLKDPDEPRTTEYDVYGFGILLWELLSGRQPFEEGTYVMHTQNLY